MRRWLDWLGRWRRSTPSPVVIGREFRWRSLTPDEQRADDVERIARIDRLAEARSRRTAWLRRRERPWLW
jgi:hypothetical protein